MYIEGSAYTAIQSREKCTERRQAEFGKNINHVRLRSATHFLSNRLVTETGVEKKA